MLRLNRNCAPAGANTKPSPGAGAASPTSLRSLGYEFAEDPRPRADPQASATPLPPRVTVPTTYGGIGVRWQGQGEARIVNVLAKVAQVLLSPIWVISFHRGMDYTCFRSHL